MKVIVVGDTPNVPTGFSRCTRSLANSLHSAGHEVLVLGMHEKGDPHDLPYKIYPCRQPFDGGFDEFGETRLPVMVARHRPDVVCIIQDPWNISGYTKSLSTLLPSDFSIPPVVGWLAVDSMNHDGQPLNSLAHVVTWTQFGIYQLVRGGYSGTYDIVPLGVDLDTFKPLDRPDCRRRLTNSTINDDAFIVGLVGRNQPRKRIDIAIQSFSQWIHSHSLDNAYLFLHVAPTGDVGYDIKSLADYYRVRHLVRWIHPDIGVGVSDSDMALFYNTIDCLLMTSQAEGWGLPVSEAMACGTPCIVPDFAAFDSELGWPRPQSVLRAPCGTRNMTAPVNTNMFTIGASPDVVSVVRNLNLLYRSRELRDKVSEAAISQIREDQYRWTTVGDTMTGILKRVAARPKIDRLVNTK